MEALEHLRAYRVIGWILGGGGVFALGAGLAAGEERLAVGGGILAGMGALLLVMSLDNRLGRFVRWAMWWMP